jgi:uracil-DNA glycosylase family protein
MSHNNSLQLWPHLFLASRLLTHPWMPAIEYPGALPFLPEHATLPVLRKAVQSCRGCDLYEHATQAVLGEGPGKAALVMIGEQPGNDEDLKGRPFVGPAGRLLDRALEEAGIERNAVYLTNAVKHFKFEERGKRRIHKKPSTGEMRACYPWLEAELAIIKPRIVGCLGATAAQAILGNQFRLTKERGRTIQVPLIGTVIATVHPSAILRAPDAAQRDAEYHRFVADLKAMKKLIAA